MLVLLLMSQNYPDYLNSTDRVEQNASFAKSSHNI